MIRDIYVKEFGFDYDTGEKMLALTIGCITFVATRKRAAEIVFDYLENPEGCEEKWYKEHIQSVSIPTPITNDREARYDDDHCR
jgi:hypothetical protein